jgi:hypothetical protein
MYLSGPHIDLPDPQLGVLGPQDHKFPLPGMVGPIPQLHQTSDPVPTKQDSDLFTQQLPGDRHLSILRQFANTMYDVSYHDYRQIHRFRDWQIDIILLLPVYNVSEKMNSSLITWCGR